MPDHELASLSVVLFGFVGQVAGYTWPVSTDGKPLAMAVIESPRRVSVELPNGRRVEFDSVNTTILQDKGRITLVSVLPLDSAVEFPTAVRCVDAIARDQEIGSWRFFEELKAWLKAPPNPEPGRPQYRARAKLGDGIDFDAIIRPRLAGDGWFVVIEVQ